MTKSLSTEIIVISWKRLGKCSLDLMKLFIKTDRNPIDNTAFISTIELNHYYYRKLVPELYLHERNSTYKPAAKPKYYQFLYVFNGFNSREAILATNTLLNTNWINSSIYSSISGSEDMLFTTAFWWKKTDTIYVITEKKHKPRNGCVFKFDSKSLRNGCVFKFDSKSLRNPFSETVSSLQTYNWFDFFILSFLKLQIF